VQGFTGVDHEFSKMGPSQGAVGRKSPIVIQEQSSGDRHVD